jgi:hypothetical protein
MNPLEAAKSSAEPANRLQRPSMKPGAARRPAAVSGKSGSCSNVAGPPPSSDNVIPLGGDSGGITMAVRSRAVPAGEGSGVGRSERADDDLSASEGMVADVAEGRALPEQAARAASNTAAARLMMG